MDKKNTILLTVIAVATLLVAVVGATFAFFTAQNNGSTDTKVEVKTETTDSLLFGSADPLYIIANQVNFADVSGGGIEENFGSQKAVSTSEIKFTRGANSSQKYCYTAKLTVDSSNGNNFVYAPEETNFNEDQDGRNAEFKRNHAPELLLKVTKKTVKTGTDGGSSEIVYEKPLGAASAADCSDDSSAKATCIYHGHLTQQRRVCTQNNTEYKDSDEVHSIDDVKEIQYSGCADNVPLEGYDITVL